MIPRALEDALYGQVPTELPALRGEVIEEGAYGAAWRRQLRLTLAQGGRETSFNLLVYVPHKGGKFPVVLSANLNGNRSVVNDPKVLRSPIPERPYPFLVPENARVPGKFANKFPIDYLLSRGYAIATFHHDEAEPDRAGEKRWGVRSLYPGARWGAVAAWAWASSRAIDVLEDIPEINARQIFLYGFSRAGKAALLAAAADTRLAGVIAEGSGRFGAALSSSNAGEPPLFLRMFYPHWFIKGFHIPEEIDQDALIAAIPCPAIVAVGEDDAWSDPRGQKLAVERAGKATFMARPGGHIPVASMWQRYCAFMERVR